MDQELGRYLNDHLAGSAAAVALIQKIIDQQEDPEAKRFFEELYAKVEADRDVLKNLETSIQHEASIAMQIAGNLTARIGSLKLMWEGIHPGKLGMLEALEMLAIGIQGKSLLWVVLADLAEWFPEWEGIDFVGLEQEAVRQRDSVERWRLEAARESLISPARKTARFHPEDPQA